MTKRNRSDSEESINWGGRLDDHVVDFLRDPFEEYEDPFEEYEDTFIDDKLVSIGVIPDGKHKIKIINVKKFYNEEISFEGMSHLVIEGSWKDNKKNGNFTITKYITSSSNLLFQIECKFIDDTIVQNESDGLTTVFFGDFNKATFCGLISEFDESNGGHFSLISGKLSFDQRDTWYEGDFENWRYNGTGQYFTINKNVDGYDFGFAYTGKFLNNKFINGYIHVFGNFNEIEINGDFSNQTNLLNLDGNYSVEFLNDKFNDVDEDSESDVDSTGGYNDHDYNKYSFKIKFSNSTLTRDIEEGCVYCEWCKDTVQGINLTNYNLRSKGINENTLDRCLFCLEEKPLIVFKNCHHKLYCIDCIRIIVDRKYEKLKEKVDYLFRSFTIYCDKFLTLKE